MKRITIVAGHYGSGKTEFAVNLALALKSQGKKTALVDLDVANPYFRSRERRQLLTEAGIAVYADAYGGEITAELPAITAAVRTPLEDEGCYTVIDLGGNDAGARVLNQFAAYFQGDAHQLLAVVNFNRPDTATLEGAVSHLEAIQATLGMPINALVNNTHLLRETTAEVILTGDALCRPLLEATGLPLYCTCYPAPLVDPAALQNIPGDLVPLHLYMRPHYLDL